MASKQFPLSADAAHKADWRKTDGFTLPLVGMDIAVFTRAHCAGTRESIVEGDG
jgi:hypothetical protein